MSMLLKYYLNVTNPVNLCIFCPCFTWCKSWTFYTIFEILHGKNFKHNYKLIYNIEINLQLNIIMYLHLLYKKNNCFI